MTFDETPCRIFILLKPLQIPVPQWGERRILLRSGDCLLAHNVPERRYHNAVLYTAYLHTNEIDAKMFRAPEVTPAFYVKASEVFNYIDNEELYEISSNGEMFMFPSQKADDMYCTIQYTDNIYKELLVQSRLARLK